ncbi:hypothetical protein FRC10_001762 [Ceratobasidium sp. 414]|nr:hypothetical protein FRC10_001762 [Ceratobasidium sp. 414]
MPRMTPLEFDEIHDKDHDFLVDSEPKPEPEVVCVNAGYLPNSDDRQTYIRVTDRPTDVSPSKAPSPVRNQSHTGAIPGFGPRPRLNLGRLTDEESLRMQETSNKSQGLVGYRFVTQPTRFPSGSAVARGSIANRSESTPLGGVAPVPIAGVSRFPRSMSPKDSQNASSATAGPQFSRVQNTSNTPGQPIQTPATPSTTSSPSHESLPELVPDTDTSDGSSELNTSSDEQCAINNVIIRSSSKGSYAGLRRVRGLVSRAQPKSSPLYAPKEIVEAQVARENKVAALLHRSQWKQKQKWWTATEKSAKKAPAPVDLRLVPDTNTSDIPSELGTSSDERCEVGNVISRPSSKSSNTSTTRICGLITRAHPKRSPLYAPMMEAEVVRGEDRVAAVLHRSQWKQKQKRWAASKKSAKARAAVDLRPRLPVVEPMGTTAVGAGASRCGVARAANPVSDVMTTAPMELVTEHTLSPYSPSPINDLETSDQIPRPTLAAMTPKGLAPAMNRKAKKAGGTRKVRFAPIYALLDTKRVVLNQGEIIPPHTWYQVEDEQGTLWEMTGSNGILV